jgi:hypothetical protein
VRIGQTVRSAIHEHYTDELVLWWVNTRESSPLYVLSFGISLFLAQRALDPCVAKMLPPKVGVGSRRVRNVEDELFARLFTSMVSAPTMANEIKCGRSMGTYAWINLVSVGDDNFAAIGSREGGAVR